MEYAARLKGNLDVPVIAVGGIRRQKTMERIIERGDADFISLCRPLIRQPSLINKMARDRQVEGSCTNCNRCIFEVGFYANPVKCYQTSTRDG